MITLLALAVKSTLVLGGVLLLCRLRWLSAAERHLLLVLGLISLPLLVLTELLPDRSVTLVSPLGITGWNLPFEPRVRDGDVDPAGSALPLVTLDTAVTAVYLAGVGMLLLAWLTRLVGTARWVGDTRVLPPMQLAGPPAGPSADPVAVPVRESASIDSPVTWGVLAPEIVLPRSWPEWSAAKRQAVLAHELAHVRRRDTLTTMLSALVCCFFWVQPLAWLAHRQLRLEAEQACDDSVLDSGIAAVAYAELLLDLARAGRAGAVLAMASPSTLPARIRALLNPSLRRTTMNRSRMSTTALLALAVILPLGSIRAVSQTGESAVAGTAERPPVTEGVAAHPPVMSEAVYLKLAEAQELIEAERFDAASEVIEQMKHQSGSMNGNEIGQIHNIAGFIEFSAGDYWGAVYEYEQVLAQGDAIPVGLRTQTLYTLAQLNWVNQEYRAALRHIQQWLGEAENPGPTPQVFMAQVHYQLDEYPAAIERLEAALDVARAEQVEIREQWWALLSYLYGEVGRLEEAVSILQRLMREHPSPKYQERLHQLQDTGAGAASRLPDRGA